MAIEREIHAFCARLLRLHAVEAQLDPSFRVLDAAEARLLREDALLLAENRLRESEPEAFRAYRSLGSRPRPMLVEMLEQLRGTVVALDALDWHALPFALDGALGAVAACAADFAAERRVPR